MTFPDSPAVDVVSMPSAAGAPTDLVLMVNMRLDPTPKERPRTAKGRTYTPSKTREAEASIGLLLRSAMKGGQPFAGRLHVALRFDCTHRRRVDLDNYAKLVLDAGNGIVWVDDAQIDRLDLTRRRGTSSPLIRLEVGILGDAA